MRLTPTEESLLVLARRQGGLLHVHQCYAEGLSPGRVRTLLERQVWARPARGVVDTRVELPIHPLDAGRERAAWLGLLSGGPEAVSVGLCALALHRVEGLPARIVPEIALPGGRHNRGSNIRIRRYRRPVPVVQINGRTVADVPYALAQALPSVTRLTGVSLLDSALRQGLLRPHDGAVVADQLRERRGGRRCLGWLDSADARAESPLETRARLLAADAGLPASDLQVKITDQGGRMIARGDLGWRLGNGAWVLAEIDSELVHSAPAAVFADRRRQNAVMLEGDYRILRFTARDLGDGTFIATLRRALTR